MVELTVYVGINESTSVQLSAVARHAGRRIVSRTWAPDHTATIDGMKKYVGAIFSRLQLCLSL